MKRVSVSFFADTEIAGGLEGFVERFWQDGYLPVKRSLVAIIKYGGTIEVQADCVEIDKDLMPRFDIYDLQDVFDSTSKPAPQGQEKKP